MAPQTSPSPSLLLLLGKWKTQLPPQSHYFDKNSTWKNPYDWIQKVSKRRTYSCSSCALHKDTLLVVSCSYENLIHYYGFFVLVLYFLHTCVCIFSYSFCALMGNLYKYYDNFPGDGSNVSGFNKISIC